MDSRLILLVLGTAIAVSGLPNNALLTRKSTLLRDDTRVGVYDGNATTVEKYPFSAFIQYQETLFCSGTIVSGQHVLASGDCCSGRAASDFKIVVASTDGVKGITFKVEKINIHPKYGQSELDYDFCVIKVIGKFKFSKKVQSAIISTNCSKAGDIYTFAGYGQTSAGDSNGGLRAGNMRLQTQKFCKNYYASYGFRWTKRMGCLYNKGKTTLCRYDWAVCAMPKGSRKCCYVFIAGATSGFCTKYAGPSIMANVPPVYKWINTIIKE